MPVVEETPVDKLPSVTYAADPMVSRFSAIFHMPSVSPEKNRSQSANDTCETAEDIHLIPISEQVESIKKTFESDDSCTERRTSTSTIVQTEDTVSKSNGEVKQSAGATLISSDDGLINIEHPIGSGIISDLEESQIHSSTTDGIIPAERSLTGKERANVRWGPTDTVVLPDVETSEIF